MRGFESHPYIPNSVPDVQAEMLKEIGMSSLEELHKNVPELLKLKEEMNLPEAFGSEYELRRHVERLLSKDTDCKKNLNFLGAGCWQHYVPAICDEINGKGEFLTAYGGEPRKGRVPDRLRRRALQRRGPFPGIIRVREHGS